MALTAAGIGSGLDIEGIVSQLMTLERQPLRALESRESDTQAQLSSYGRLKSAVSDFQEAMETLGDMDKFKVFAATSSDEDVAGITTSAEAAQGVYSLTVDRLAQNHKLATAEFADTDTFGGTAGDTMTLTVGAESMTLDLSTAQTLEQLRDSINDDTTNPGITASIMNTGDGVQRLILTSQESGYDNRIELSGAIYSAAAGATEDPATTFTFAMANQKADGSGTLDALTDLDAAFKIDGFSLTSGSNSVESVIDGISLDLKSVGSSMLEINRDTESIEESAKSLVDAYNKVHSLAGSLRNGALSGDRTTLTLQGQLRSVLNTAPTGLTGSYSALTDVGITTDPKTGELVFNSSDFSDALSADFRGVAELFANDDQGYAFRFAAAAESILADDGLIDAREDGLQARIDRLQDSQTDFERRLEMKEKALRSQFASLDGLIGSLNTTSQFLSQQLGALVG